MSNPIRLAIVVIAIVFGLLVYFSMNLNQHTFEVCMEFNGRTNCATASGTTEQEAIRTATDTACAIISFGMTESIQCSRVKPLSVTSKK